MVTRRRFFVELVGNLVSQAQETAVTCLAGRSAQVRVPQAPWPAPSSSEPAPIWLRPPGALEEPDFLSRCTRCTDCLTACPHQAIRRLGPEFGAAAGTPAIIPTETPCYLCEGLPCIAACVPGALLPVAVPDVRLGTARLNPGACYLSAGQPCDYCLVRCPLRGTAIRLGGDGLPIIDPAACTGCGVCAYLCPGQALTIEPTGQIEASEPE